MKLTRCKQCGQNVSVHFDNCPHCGGKIQILPATALLKFLAAVILLVVLIGGFVALKNHKTHDNDSTKDTSSSANADGASQ